MSTSHNYSTANTNNLLNEQFTKAISESASRFCSGFALRMSLTLIKSQHVRIDIILLTSMANHSYALETINVFNDYDWQIQGCMFIVHIIAVLSLNWLYGIKLCRTTLVGFGKFKIDITTK